MQINRSPVLIALALVGQAMANCEYIDRPKDAFPADSFPDRGEKATVTITTVPPGSDVYMDKEYLGVSPVTKEFHSGNLQLYISEKTGGRLGHDIPLCLDTVKVWPNSTLELKVNTVMPFGNVQVKSDVAGCSIDYDGSYFNRTDGQETLIRRVPAGTHEIKITCKNGVRKTIVEVKGDQTVVADFTKKAKK